MNPEEKIKIPAQPLDAEITPERSRHDFDDARSRAQLLELLFLHVADAIFVAEMDGRIVEANPAACAMMGFSKQELLTFHQWDIVTSASREEILKLWHGMKPGVPVSVQRTCRTKRGEQFVAELRLARCALGGRDLIIVSCRDMTEQTRAKAMLAGEKRLLEMVAKGEPLTLILEALCRTGEEMSPETLVSILLIGSDGKSLRHGAAPSLPSRYTEAIDGALIGPSAGSCGTAAYRKEPVIVSDIETDPLWANYRHLALPEGLRAAWSTPIFSTARQVIGTFALYSSKPGQPTPQQQAITEQFAHLTSIAIERTRAQEALHASEHLARGQVEVLKRAVDALATEADPDRLLGHILCTITEQFGAHSTSVWRRDEASGRIGLESVFEDGKLVPKTDARFAGRDLWLPMEEFRPWTEVFRTGKASVIEDIRTGKPFPLRDRLLPLGIITVLLVPMFVTGRLEGAIGIRFTRKRSFRAEEIELAQALVNQAMLAMQLSSLHAQGRQAAVMEERNRMARDIHDTLAQGFTGVIMQLEAAKGAAMHGDVAEAANRIERAGELARSSLGEARRSVRALRPRSLSDGGLFVALDSLLKRMTEGTDLSAEFHAEGGERSIPAEHEECLLRVTQEALTNAVKHATARNFRATLRAGADKIQLQLVDDGCGFDPQAEHDGFGIIGMKERVDRVNGVFIIRAKPGVGTEILVELGQAVRTETGESK